jgi:hypothetical protein
MCCADTLALAESRREFNGCADDCVSCAERRTAARLRAERS